MRAAAGPVPSYEVVVPSAGRATLARLIRSLGAADGAPPQRVLVVDDRRSGEALDCPRALASGTTVEVLRSGGRGPAAARNAGWAAARAEWVVFLDDDVIVPPSWPVELAADLAGLAADVAACQGRIVVPLPAHRRPTDWERNVAGLERARWATADMACRRAALAAVGGFDERFRRAYREDSDLGLRLRAGGLAIAHGKRHVVHPVGEASALVSLRLQAGNADDVLMRALHGRDWRSRAGAPPGRLRRHLAVASAALLGCGAALTGRRRLALAAATGWLAGTAELAWARIAPGPRTAAEVGRMLATSLAMPFAAGLHFLRGHARVRRLVSGTPAAPQAGTRPLAVLLDRDGTLIEDVPYCRDAALVRPLPGVREALDRLRAHGVRLAVVSNQSGVARGLVDQRQLAAVNARVEELLGPLGPWLICTHAPGAGCRCRKPAPGLVIEAARRLGIPPARCVVIGDIGSDVEAAHAAGARAVLVPTPATRREEVTAAPEVAATIGAAVDLLVGSSPSRADSLTRGARATAEAIA